MFTFFIAQAKNCQLKPITINLHHKRAAKVNFEYFDKDMVCPTKETCFLFLSFYKRFISLEKSMLMAEEYLLFDFFEKLGPGRPSAGGPRMDRQAVTSPGVVKISRLASRV